MALELKIMIYYFRQNYIEGQLIEDDEVFIGEHLLIEENTKNKAIDKRLDIADTVEECYLDYCPCCGSRWDSPVAIGEMDNLLDFAVNNGIKLDATIYFHPKDKDPYSFEISDVMPKQNRKVGEIPDIKSNPNYKKQDFLAKRSIKLKRK